MQENLTSEDLEHFRQEIIAIETTDDHENLAGMVKQATINAIENYSRVITNVNNLAVKRDEQPQDLRMNFLFVKQKNNFFFVNILAINNVIVLIRRQIEQLENEKNGLAGEFSIREQNLKLEFEEKLSEKE